MPDHLVGRGAKASAPCPVDQALPSVFEKLDLWRQDFGAPFLIALSGGGDSMALCCLAARWAQEHGGQLYAVSIDHGLRPEAAQEAAQAIAWAQALGLQGEVLKLAQRPAYGGLQAWAREARYRALAGIAARIGAKLILIGHTWDDQVETVCWRLARQSGLDGLAGMAELAANSFAAPEAPNVLGRPLLGLKRADLRLWLARAGQAWLEDDSNQNLDFARIRTRKLVREMAAQGVEFARIIRLASMADRLRTAQEQASFDLLKRCGLNPIEAGWRLDGTALLQAEALIGERALGWLIYSLTQAERPPEAEKLGRLWASLQSNPTRAKTLAGVWACQKGSHFLVRCAPPRRDQKPVDSPTAQSQYRRLFAVSRQPHKFVTQLN